MPTKIKPFLVLPFHAHTGFAITEGWVYSDEERRVHGHCLHYAIDFGMPRRSPVVAAAEGWAVASYQLAYSGTFQGKAVGFGYGHFVQIWHPNDRLYTVYAHLDRASARIPYAAPKKVGKQWNPIGLYAPPEIVQRGAVFVGRGEIIGFVGDSGLSWGYEEAPFSRPDPARFPSWDETHLHFEVYSRDSKGYRKEQRFDPFGIYAGREQYGPLRPTDRGLWLVDRHGLPRFAE